MRAIIAILAFALYACDREPSFDERYAKSEEQIEQRGRELDRQLNGTATNGQSDARSDQ